MRRNANHIQVIEHDEPDETGLQDLNDFLDRAHPENDDYMKSVEHVQRQIMHANSLLRTKQVNILKTIFAGHNYTDTASRHNTSPQTVSKLVRSTNGQRLLNLLQYHLKLLEGPNEGLRRNMLWRIAADSEEIDPKTSIKAISELNKMWYQAKQLEQNLTGPTTTQQAPTVIINIDSTVMPKTTLDN